MRTVNIQIMIYIYIFICVCVRARVCVCMCVCMHACHQLCAPSSGTFTGTPMKFSNFYSGFQSLQYLATSKT